MSMAPQSRAAIVTGGSAGIGFAVAEMLAETGYRLTIVARDEVKLAAAGENLRAGAPTS
jgi:short-subunit dehydrogenase